MTALIWVRPSSMCRCMTRRDACSSPSAVGLAAAWQLVRIPKVVAIGVLPALLGSAFAGYIFYVQSTGQSSPYNLFPYYAGAWCVLGLLIVLVSPRLAARIGDKLSRAELGGAAEEAPEKSPAAAGPE